MYKVDHIRREKVKRQKENPKVIGGIATILMIVIVAAAIFMFQTVTRKPGASTNGSGQAAYLITSSPESTGGQSESLLSEEPFMETEAPLTEEEVSQNKKVADGLNKAKLQLESKYVTVMSEDGTILFGKEPDAMMYPASMTKLMTALVVVEQVPDLTKQAMVSGRTMDYTYDEEGSNAGFDVWEKASILDMLYGVLLPSGAECSVTLAEYVAGTHEKFVGMMNQKAAELGMTSTHFTNCVGFHHKKHYSSTKDIAILLKACLQNDTIKKIIVEKSHKVGKTNKHPQGFTFRSSVYKRIRKLDLKRIDFLGGKSGYTREAGQCLATAAIINGRQYILVTGCSKTASEGIGGCARDLQTVYETIRDIG